MISRISVKIIYNCFVTKSYLIWHPNLARTSEQFPKMTNHIRYVNFSCKHPERFNFVKKTAELPQIKYTESTITRSSYVNPSRFPELNKLNKIASKVPNSPNMKPVTGIVPNLTVPEYLPVLEK